MELQILRDFYCKNCDSSFEFSKELERHIKICKLIKREGEAHEIRDRQIQESRTVSYLSEVVSNDSESKVRRMCEPKFQRSNMKVFRHVQRTTKTFQWDGYQKQNFEVTVKDVDQYDYSDTEFFFLALTRTQEGREKLASEMRRVCERYEKWFNKTQQLYPDVPL